MFFFSPHAVEGLLFLFRENVCKYVGTLSRPSMCKDSVYETYVYNIQKTIWPQSIHCTLVHVMIINDWIIIKMLCLVVVLFLDLLINDQYPARWYFRVDSTIYIIIMMVGNHQTTYLTVKIYKIIKIIYSLLLGI